MKRAGEPDALLALARGVMRQCPRCGRGKLFRRWFNYPKTCPRCGLRFEREEGAFLGSLTINYGVTGIVFFALLIGWMVATGGQVRLVPLVLASIAVVIVVPLLFYPFAKTIWAAIDFLIYRSDPSYAGWTESDGASGRGGTSA
jgi:uncharacterized protein (DUF983 family)